MRDKIWWGVCIRLWMVTSNRTSRDATGHGSEMAADQELRRQVWRRVNLGSAVATGLGFPLINVHAALKCWAIFMLSLRDKSTANAVSSCIILSVSSRGRCRLFLIRWLRNKRL